MISLYSASGLILLRNIVRVVEYVQVYDGYINHHEWFLYIFDATLMFGVMMLMKIIYTPSLLAQKGEEELSEARAELQLNHPEQVERA